MSNRSKASKSKDKINGSTSATTSAQQARAVLKAADEQRVLACKSAMDKVLEQFNCRLSGEPSFATASPGTFSIGVKIQIVANEELSDG